MKHSLAAVLLVGCAYKPGSFSHVPSDFHGHRASVGCLDVAVERRPDVEVGPVLAYAFANRCDQPTTVDLASVPVVARTAKGERRVRPYDPRDEIAPTPLDGRSGATEALAYATRATRDGDAALCVDIGALGGAAPQWLCFDGPGAPPQRSESTYVAKAGAQ